MSEPDPEPSREHAPRAPAKAAAGPADRDPVPKLPRGRGFKLSGPELFRIVVLAVVLVALLVLTKPCSVAVSNFVNSFDNGSNKTRAMPRPDNVAPPGAAPAARSDDPSHYVRLHPGMTDEQVKAAIEQAREKARAGQGSAGTGQGSAETARGSAGTGPGSAGTAVGGQGSAGAGAGSAAGTHRE